MSNQTISTNSLCKYISKSAVEAMLYEVSASPKPGLVDRYNSGAHQDMDFFTFMSSSAALNYYFYRCAEKGVAFANQDARKLLEHLRGIGKEAERDMYQATGGVNTHKGLIFSLGIISAAAASCFFAEGSWPLSLERICKKISQITKGITIRELSSAKLSDIKEEKNLTAGERLFKQYNIKGIRGEVEKGFPTVRKTSFPFLLKYLNKNQETINDILVQVLLYLMTVTEDTNVIARHNLGMLQYVKSCALQALDLGGIFTKEGKNYLQQMDVDFRQKNISPGGSADLLAVTIMFVFLTQDMIGGLIPKER
ncbi:triphosphoribosyl-dephospho-CoA synthase CitG [Halocella sp. SP3-1]|uniref:triphosphoribosyl-dephospho-CoA synthase CitG n=1 Tax=Halocella sp. SP3-1 TaxID=2382161 RepID=UPI000F75A5BE|nr:triphosphoribosyl-dephospho-CoA synthase CitG [Halocella sp. SP3-1]AZO94863.1 triphosphoribosyl-dephospho-CoA synthase CitG [Halocella sp. SP3-1]